MPRVTSSIRFSDHERDLFRAAADRQRMTLSEWTRTRLRAAAEAEDRAAREKSRESRESRDDIAARQSVAS